MKPWITKIAVSAFALVALSLSSCKKDEVRTVLTPSNTPTLTASATTVTLTQANAANTAVTFTWTPVKSLSLSDNTTTLPNVTYYLQFDTKGHNFSTPVSIAAGSASTTAATSTTTVTMGDLNTALTTLGLTAGTAADVEVRLNASYASNSTTYSNTLPLNVTTYKVCVPPTGSSTWSIIGPAGVDWNTDVPLVYNCDTKTFDITRALSAGDFKFRANSDWTVNYGSSSNTGGALVVGGNNITVAKAGTYTIKLDLNNMVYSIK